MTAVMLGAAAFGPAEAVIAAPASARTADAALAATDWPQFLHDPGHTSVDAADTAITPANVGTLGVGWSWTPPNVSGRPNPTLLASPTVAGGLVYQATRSGWLYALAQSTGKQVWAADTGYVATGCSGSSALGLTATPAVSADPSTGHLVVYEAGADRTGSAGNITLYAFDAATGQQLWATLVSAAKGAYAWSSPMVAGGHVYVGVSSACDNPLVTGEVVGIDQSSGAVNGTYQADATGVLGAGIWTTPASDGTDVWATTGNGATVSGKPDTPVGDEESLVRINGSTLAREDGWQVPPSQTNQDFASSPTLWSAARNGSTTQFVGACDKNGIFYALDRSNLSAGPIWQTAAAPSNDAACDPAAVWDSANNRLDLGTSGVTVGGTRYPGSIVQLDAGTGAIIWRTGMPSHVLGSPTLNGSGILAAGTWTSYADMTTPADVVLMSAANGTVLRQIATNGPVFAQPVFAGGDLLVASAASLTAYAPAASSPMTIEQNSGAVSYDGWSRVSLRAALAGGVRRSATAADTTSYAFTGTSVSWQAFTGSASGRASVTIDGRSARVVDLYAGKQARKAVTFANLPSGRHTIRVNVVHTKNAQSKGFAVSSDGFSVPAGRIDDAAVTVGYDTWTGVSTPNASGGSYITSSSAGAHVAVTFSGSTVRWLTATGPAAGRADVTLDGVDQGQVDLYSPSQAWQVPETYHVGLGQHVLQVTVLGSASPSATGSAVVVDAFTVS